MHSGIALNTELCFEGPFEDWPVVQAAERYEEVARGIVERWVALADAPVSIYRIGTIGAPGLSDLDFVVVFARAGRLPWKAFQPKSFPGEAQYFMNHAPYACTQSQFEELRGWYPVFQLKHQWGKTLSVRDLPEALRAGCAFGLLADYLMLKVPRDIYQVLWQRPLKVRSLIAHLYSTKHCFRLAQEAGIVVKPVWSEALQQLDALRHDWFALDSERTIARLKQCCFIVCGAMEELVSAVDQALGPVVPRKRRRPHRWNVCGQSYFFTSEWSLKAATELAHKQFRTTGLFDWAIPESFLSLLLLYARDCSALRGHVPSHRDINDGLLGKLGWLEGLKHHARCMQSYILSSTSLGVPAQKYIALGLSGGSALSRMGNRVVLRTNQLCEGEVDWRRAAARLRCALKPKRSYLDR